MEAGPAEWEAGACGVHREDKDEVECYLYCLKLLLMKWKCVLAMFLLLPLLQTSAQQVKQEPPKVYSYVEQMPEAGYDWNKYLSNNLKYPDSARLNNVEGRIVAKFIINEDGSISDATILRGIGSGCDEEVLRLLSKAPRWKPGMQNGKAVRVYFTMPVVFKLESPAEKVK
jgi:TonB family protein